jgi:prolyl-tRNA synthetase
VDRHVTGLVAGRDFVPDGTIEAATIRDGDPCPVCGGRLLTARGIEIGHVFQLGRKYSEVLGLAVLDRDGKRVTVTMGSYGIGVSRALGAIAEQTADDRGLCWPKEVAPAQVHLLAAGKEPSVRDAAETIAAELSGAGIPVLFDDRHDVSPGVKFNDSELLGVPTIVVVGRRIADGIVELKDRRSGVMRELHRDQVLQAIT